MARDDRKLKDLTFQELVDEATQYIHSELLISGGKGMRSAVFLWLNTAIAWKQEVVEAEAKKRGKK